MTTTAATATLKTRYNFTAQYVGGAVLLARRARMIEALHSPSPLECAEHRSLVVGAVQQSAAAIEAELNAVVEHGPGHHLGSNGTDAGAREFLDPLAEIIDGIKGPLERWAAVLHVLRKPHVPKNQWPWQDAKLLVGLRNELVHYRSRLDGATRGKLLEGLASRRFRPPPFVHESVNEFPMRTLSADCADWSATAASAFLDTVGDALGGSSALDGHRSLGADLASAIPCRGAVWSPRATPSKQR